MAGTNNNQPVNAPVPGTEQILIELGPSGQFSFTSNMRDPLRAIGLLYSAMDHVLGTGVKRSSLVQPVHGILP